MPTLVVAAVVIVSFGVIVCLLGAVAALSSRDWAQACGFAVAAVTFASVAWLLSVARVELLP